MQLGSSATGALLCLTKLQEGGNELGVCTQIFILFLKDFIHSFRRDRERQRHRQREKQAPCREPNVGLDPGTAGSCPEPRADAQR